MTTSKKRISGLWAAMMLMLFSAFQIQAQPGQNQHFMLGVEPGPMGEMMAFWMFGGSPNNPNSPDVDSYKLYYAEGEITDVQGNFSQFTEAADFDADDAENQGGMYMYSFILNLDDGVYTFALEATLSNGGTEISEPAITRIGGQIWFDNIVFTTAPDFDKIQKGQTYTYDADAVYLADTTEALKYEVHTQSPNANVSIDEQTGLVTFSTTEAGPLHFVIIATLVSDTNQRGVQPLHFFVQNCADPAVLTGTLKDQNGNLIDEGHVVLFPAENNGGPNGGLGGQTEVENGTFSFETDGGDYILFYTTKFGQQFWYENAATHQTAKTITLNCAATETIDWTIDVPTATKYNVSGYVKDADGNPIEDAFVIFESVYNQNHRHHYIQLEAMTDQNGYYEAELPDSYTYVAFAVNMNNFGGPGFGPQMELYYNQTYDRSKAEEINLTADRNDINFTFGQTNDFTLYTVSGYVKYDDGTPIADAMVAFQGFNDNPGRGYHNMDFETMTDANGYYEIELPDAFKYVGMAQIIDGFFWDVQFYDGVKDPSQATTIELTANKSGVDFTFEKTNTGTASISGTVKDETGNEITDAGVIAFNIDGNNQQVNPYQAVYAMTNQLGEYKIDNLVAGKYIVLAVPDGRDYLPGFYNATGLATMEWKDATEIDVVANQAVAGIHIVLEELNQAGFPGMKGRAKISGRIRGDHGQNKTQLSGAQVYLKDAGGNPVMFGQSNSNGSFILDEIVDGSYTLEVNKVGYHEYSQQVEVEENLVDLGDLTLTPTDILSVEDDNTAGLKVYPNPAVEKINLVLNGESDAGISVMDISGNALINTTAQQGTLVKTLNVANLGAGVYYVNIEMNGITKVIPFVIIK